MKTVYMCFATDVIHEGHMNVVKKAKEYGKVVAGVLCDAEMVRYNRFPTVSFEERMAMVRNIPEIDEVIVQDRIMYDNVIKELKPDYVIPFKLDKKAAKEALSDIFDAYEDHIFKLFKDDSEDRYWNSRIDSHDDY